MPLNDRSRRHAPGAASFLWVVVLAMIGGCSAPARIDLDSEQAVSAAAGFAEAIKFHAEGAPLDEPNDPASLSLSDAVRIAIMTDPEVQAALARVRIAQADAHQSRLLPNPILNLAVRFPEGGGKPIIEASLAQDLIAALKVPKASSVADNRLRAASAEAVTTAINAVAEVERVYVTIQSLERLMPVLEQRRNLLVQVRRVASARLSAGEGTRDDVVLLDAQSVELDVESALASQELRDERLMLARRIGRPSGAAAWTLDAWTSPATTERSEAEWIEAALQARPEVQAVAWSLAALGDEWALTSLLPWEGASAGVDVQRDGVWQVGPAVSLPLPVFDTGQARRERLSAEQIEARHRLVQAKRGVVEDVRRALDSIKANREGVRRVRDELIPLQEQRRRLAESSFKAGHSDAMALFLSEQAVRASQVRLVELERAEGLATVALHRAVGGPGPAASIPSPTPTKKPASGANP